METTTYYHYINAFRSSILEKYLPGKKIGVLDIETLGLNPAYCQVILAGLLTVGDDGNAKLTQFFAEDVAEEKNLLEALFKEVNKCDYLLTYNGKHFDLPFLNKRSVLSQLDEMILPYNLDLYLFLHGHSQLKRILPDLKQKTVEKYQGLSSSRSDEISGAKSVELYKHYLSAKDIVQKKAIKEQILLHNHDDVLQLYRIMPVIKTTDLHRGFFSHGFQVRGSELWPPLQVEKIKIQPSNFTISGKYLSSSKISYINYWTPETPYNCQFNTDGTFFFEIVPLKEGQSLFVNLNSFFDYSDSINKFTHLPGFVNNYLILKEGDAINYPEANSFIMEFLKKFMINTPSSFSK